MTSVDLLMVEIVVLSVAVSVNLFSVFFVALSEGMLDDSFCLLQLNRRNSNGINDIAFFMICSFSTCKEYCESHSRNSYSFSGRK